jgi:CRISPR/Cas system-associated exonuclease Cas4 (RecB family)
MKNISKEVFLDAVACPSLGWLLRSEQEVEGLSYESLSLAEQFRMEQGAEIGRRARNLYPDGILVQSKSFTKSVEQTLALMRDKKTPVIFEAAFQVGNYATKADILKRDGKCWHLIEVKSDTNDKPELLADLAYTAMVITQAGFNIGRASLLLISKDYRLGMSDNELFVEVDHTVDCLMQAELLRECWDQIDKLTTASTMPEPDLKLICKKCPLFYDCLGKGVENHIFELPRLSEKRFAGLKELGIYCIEDIPDHFELTERQTMVRKCVHNHTPWVSEELKGELDRIKWPAFYLDFETTMTAIPLYPDIAPYTQLVTQYSAHKCSKLGVVMAHKYYLSDHNRDDRRRLAEALVNDLEKNGSIITYSPFEKTTVNNLAGIYPDLAGELSALVERMVDLEVIINKNFYHHGFHGRTSIKVTLPVLVPEMSYDNFEITEGDSASAAFACLAMGKYKTETEVKEIRANLLKYCAQDTLAMVKLHERLHAWE